MKGYIHSSESFGTLDGPGIRYVLFMQGCPMRCLYCHNPDTWQTDTGTEIEAQDVIKQFNKNRSFYSNGGITVSGGEPLLQIDFLTELFELAKKDGIHTAIDTSGITFSGADNAYRKKLDKLMEYTDLVMLDIKHIDTEKHRALTAHGNSNILAFAKYLEEKGIPLWVRHVLVEGYTDNDADLFALGKFIGGLKNLKALDVLPYHTMGAAKYKELGIPYALEGVKPTSNEQARLAREIILSGIRAVRQKKTES
ncbi:MAG: pyruvate formate lyase-activating protein [Ruminococcaceae bacterium]|nr:pyruvate formate lyase-activating protein [Oscillospiraceae bacterium]